MNPGFVKSFMKKRRIYGTTEVAEKYSVSSKRQTNDSGAWGIDSSVRGEVIVKPRGVRKCPG